MAVKVGLQGHGALVVNLFGILGNIISGVVFFSPVPTFYTIYKTKTTSDLPHLPYLVSLFSCGLWLAYGLIKTNQTYLIIINSVGVVVEVVYIILFTTYSSRPVKVNISKLLIFLMVFLFPLIILSITVFAPSTSRTTIMGYICDSVTIIVFFSPLVATVRAIKTKDITTVPLFLSSSLTAGAVAWFGYGFLNRDMFIMVPNIVGFILGAIQILVYIVVKNYNK